LRQLNGQVADVKFPVLNATVEEIDVAKKIVSAPSKKP
jgi:hypothetical protein